MSKKVESPDNIYTQQVKNLVDLVYPQESGQGSVYEDARHFFTVTPSLEDHAHDLKMQIGSVRPSQKESDKAAQLKQKLKKAQLKLEEERLERVGRIHEVARKLLDLCEGDSYEETQLLSAKFLGTIMLQTRGKVAGFQRFHQRLKPLYKAVLTLRLTDKMFQEQTVKNPYLIEHKNALSRFDGDSNVLEKWQTGLAIPLICAAILQDIGLQSPDVLLLLRGADNELDEFRVLEAEQRKALLKYNYQYTMDYLKKGLGIPKYVGNNKEERDEFVAHHKAANQFMHTIAKDAFVSKSGLGELLKIPQIYASIVLSTKPDYSRKELPKGYLLIEQLAKKGALNEKLAEAFIKIVGYFPQGFGITFIPVNERGEEKNQYECAVVSRLNPSHPAEPICRVATRNLTYIASGNDEVIQRARNLFFAANQKKLMRIGKDRLIEIMSQLSKDFDPENIEQLVPPFWEPNDFFSFKKNQNMWNKG
ncbi:hypothetical protein OPS25_07525 [Alteromonas ponticola]|uniref:Uncharacterized protein n=1 Tax=Alteromonas aquimaris TaxID=2998417 RepID=A0ABT3P6E2_9ALTE|nr:hypothetical protein [Alteromonas aquimaris]MCW8108341.1 hypothetical protein [Alteromonas aquimaris]